MRGRAWLAALALAAGCDDGTPSAVVDAAVDMQAADAALPCPLPADVQLVVRPTDDSWFVDGIVDPRGAHWTAELTPRQPIDVVPGQTVSVTLEFDPPLVLQRATDGLFFETKWANAANAEAGRNLDDVAAASAVSSLTVLPWSPGGLTVAADGQPVGLSLGARTGPTPEGASVTCLSGRVRVAETAVSYAADGAEVPVVTRPALPLERITLNLDDAEADDRFPYPFPFGPPPPDGGMEADLGAPDAGAE